MKDDRFHVQNGRRFDASELMRNVIQCIGGYMLSNYFSMIGNASKHEPTRAVEHGANSLCRIRPLAG